MNLIKLVDTAIHRIPIVPEKLQGTWLDRLWERVENCNSNHEQHRRGEGAITLKKMYIAFMGPPLMPVHAFCSCGTEITFGKDERGWYVDGAENIELRGSEAYDEQKSKEGDP